jgi:hypothetical protein
VNCLYCEGWSCSRCGKAPADDLKRERDAWMATALLLESQRDAARSEALLDLKDLRDDRDNIKAWSVALFAHVCRLTGADPKNGPREIQQLASDHNRRIAAEEREAIISLIQNQGERQWGCWDPGLISAIRARGGA